MLGNWLRQLRSNRRAKPTTRTDKPRRSAGGNRRTSLILERLEDRDAPSAVSWIGGAAGFWDTAANWSGHTVPNSAADVTIDTAVSATITIRARDAESIKSLTLGKGDALSITDGSLAVAAGLTNAGAITIQPGASLTVAGAFKQTALATLSMPSSGVPDHPTSNLFANPDFESPAKAESGPAAPTGWDAWGGAELSGEYALTGLQSLETSGAGSGVFQSFNVTPGDSYTLSVDAMMPSNNPLTGSSAAYIQVEFFDSGGQQLTGYTAPNAVTVLTSTSTPGGALKANVGAQGWNHFSTTVVAPATAATVHAILVVGTYNGTGPGGGAVYWADAQFGPAVAGPSTFAAGSVVNAGAITVGPRNSIATRGVFTQTSTGSLDLQLGGAPATGYFGDLSVGTTASLGGTLKSDLVFGYSPADTDDFTPITFTSASGAFTKFGLPSGPGYQFRSDITFTNVVVGAVPTTTLTTTVDAADVIHVASTNLLGVNVADWAASLDTTQTEQIVKAAGLTSFRFPGGSTADDYHFNIANNAPNTIGQFAEFIQAVDGTGIVTVDFGSGSPQEAAAELAYLQGSPTGTTKIGVGIEWNDSTSQWQYVNWGTVGYWAGLRASAPLRNDDGLNFLRIDHPAAFTDVKYWEIGNEEYGDWEVDHHGTAGPGGVSTGAQHDPATYVAFAKQFASLASEITKAGGLPDIEIGIDSQDPTGLADNYWTKNVLTDGLAVGFVPNFISDHSYMESPGTEDDSFLLDDTVTAVSSQLDWSTRYAEYESLLRSTLSSKAASVQVLATEFNSINYNPGKQSTSLVNGLFIGEALGGLLDSGYAGANVWDLSNGLTTTQNNSESLYGWRVGGDYGLVGSGDAPTSADGEPYPAYFAEQLASMVAQSGGKVVSVATNYHDFNAYGVMEPNGHLELLVINANPVASLRAQFDLSGFQPSGQVTFWQYGETEDAAQRRIATGSASLAHFSDTLSINDDSFAYSFPAYSMTVVDLAPASNLAPTIRAPATAAVIHGKTIAFTGASALSIGDPAATYSTIDTVTLRAENGTLKVNLDSGAAIVAGANGSANLTLKGTLTQLNSALAALSYTASATGAAGELTVSAAAGTLWRAPCTTIISFTGAAAADGQSDLGT